MTTRRTFLKTLGTSLAGLSVGAVPSLASVVGSSSADNSMPNLMTSRETASSHTDKVRVAFIGIGNRGEQDFDDFLNTGMV